MEEHTKEKMSKNIKRVLMFKAIGKIQDIIDKEKEQKKSDKMHVMVIITAFILALALTFILFSIIKI